MRSLLIQLARLGDLLQTLPAMTALKRQAPGEALDLLCPAPLTPIVSLFPGIDRALAWEPDRWGQWASGWRETPASIMAAARAYLDGLTPRSYDKAYNLNQHPRAMLAAHLLAEKVVGPGQTGPLTEQLTPWGAYLRQVARDGRPNHVHLADAFCGMCGVTPPGMAPTLCPPQIDLPRDLASVGEENQLWIAVIVGAGDVARCLPPAVWAQWITALLHSHADSRIVLVGSAGERERARAIQEGLSPLLLGRIWDATGRTDLLELTALLARCQWAIGSDTGSLHLAAAVGTRALGLYFARAGVHETGPYGDGHWVWQAPCHSPEHWPIEHSVALVLRASDAAPACEQSGWQLWRGQVDAWGMSFTRPGQSDSSIAERVQVWKECMADHEAETALSA